MPKSDDAIAYDELVKDDRVHSRVYTDPEIFDEELQRIFHREWVYVGHESEIPMTGDYRLVRIGTHSVIISRDEDGRVNLLLNRCRHRGNSVCQEERGNANFFRCNYHGWTYNSRGELVGVPFPAAYGTGFRREDFGLTVVPRVASYRGFIFASLSSKGRSLEEHFGKRALEQIDLFVDRSPVGEIDVRSGTQKFICRANWKLLYENAVDGYHGGVVHQSYFDIVRKRTGMPIDPYKESFLTADLGNGHALAEYESANPMRRSPYWQEYTRLLQERYGAARAERILATGGTYLAGFPNVVLILDQIRVLRPISVAATEVFVYPVLLRGLPSEFNASRLRAHEAFFGPAGFGQPDDHAILERNQLGLANELDPWLLISRGLGRERSDGTGATVGLFSDEVTNRGFLRHWKKVMSGRITDQRSRRRNLSGAGSIEG